MSDCKHKIKWKGQFNEFVCSSCAEPFMPEHVAEVMNDRAGAIIELQSRLEAAEAENDKLRECCSDLHGKWIDVKRASSNYWSAAYEYQLAELEEFIAEIANRTSESYPMGALIKKAKHFLARHEKTNNTTKLTNQEKGE